MWLRYAFLNHAWWLGCCLVCHTVGTCRWFVPLTTYYVCGTACWLTHVAGHYSWSGAWYKFHTLGHHIRSYPPSKFLQTRYVSFEARRRMTNCNPLFDLNTLMYSPWVLFTAVIHALCGVNDAGSLSVCLATGVLFLQQQDYMHTHIHLRGSWLEQYEWFYHLRHMHLKHHQNDMKHNFGVNDFVLDVIAGTLLL